MRKLLLIALLAGCTFIDSGPPRNLDDACGITRAQPGWKREMQAAERKWGLPTSVQMAIIWQESKFEARARTTSTYFLGLIPMKPRSSAYGYAQAIDSTWDWYREATGNPRARRHNFGDAVDFMGWYTNITTKRYGVPKTDVRNQYLAYHEGHGGYNRKTYLQKDWLVDVANNLVDRERMYRRQLSTCT